MPADFYIDKNRKVVFSKAVTPFTYDDAYGHMERLKADPEFSDSFNQLWDLCEISAPHLTREDVGRLSKVAVFSPQSKRAFLVEADWQYGYARMFGILRDIEGETGIRVFRESKEALAWLGLTSGPDPALFLNLRSVSEKA